MSMGSKCLECHHFMERKSRMKGRLICEAFPDGIPFSVMRASRDQACSGDLAFMPHPDPPKFKKRPATIESGGHTFQLPRRLSK
jgi:hypothetical protein